MGAILKAMAAQDKKTKNLKMKNSENYMNSSGILSSRNDHSSFISEGKSKRSHKNKQREAMTERIR